LRAPDRLMPFGRRGADRSLSPHGCFPQRGRVLDRGLRRVEVRALIWPTEHVKFALGLNEDGSCCPKTIEPFRTLFAELRCCGARVAGEHRALVWAINQDGTPRVGGIFGTSRVRANAPGAYPAPGGETYTPGNADGGFVLKRESDCTLSEYFVNFAAASVTLVQPKYEDILHQQAKLTTTPDTFPDGCSERKTPP
jgi:hypothetical protein